MCGDVGLEGFGGLELDCEEGLIGLHGLLDGLLEGLDLHAAGLAQVIDLFLVDLDLLLVRLFLLVHGLVVNLILHFDILGMSLPKFLNLI